MENQNKATPKDFFLNLGAIVFLYTVIISLLNLLFTVINNAYPRVGSYDYYWSASISWPVAILIICFPIFLLLMWMLEKGYITEPNRRQLGVRKWLTYITLFVSGLALAGDLVTVLYYFLDGQELTAGFLLKILSVLLITACVFVYYISEIRGKLTSSGRKVWVGVAVAVILASIVWGFTVLGSPHTQRLIKYDQQKSNDLMNLQNEITSFYSREGKLPEKLEDIASYYVPLVDSQNDKPYEYAKVNATKYSLCAEFNRASEDKSRVNVSYPLGVSFGKHPEGKFCFELTVNPNIYQKPVPAY